LKLNPPKNSLFGVLLRAPWWVSLMVALMLGLAAVAVLPDSLKAVGALSGMPFIVIGAMAAWRQRGRPNATRIEQTRQAVAAMAWPAFSKWLETAFQRDGYTVQRDTAGVDFVLTRQGRSTVVSARRWKGARTGLDPLRALQAAREAMEATDALYIGLGELTDTALPFSKEHRIAVWQAPELAFFLRHQRLEAR
jgi:restriction system protein